MRTKETDRNPAIFLLVRIFAIAVPAEFHKIKYTRRFTTYVGE